MIGVVADDAVREAVERRYLDAICFLADEFREPAAHGDGSGLGESEREHFLWRNLRLSENVRDTHRQDLGLPSSWPRDNHNRPVERIDGFPLLRIQFFIAILEGVHMIRE